MNRILAGAFCWIALLALVAAPVPAGPVGEPVTQAACPDAPEPQPVLQWDSQLENLAFDESGNLVVVDWGSEELLWLTADGLQGSMDWPGALGVVYNAAQDTFYATGLRGEMAGPAGIVSFRLDGGFVDITPYADGLAGANGLAFGPDGALYASNPLAAQPPYLLRIEPGGGSAPWNDRYGPNGLWPADGGLYAAITGDQSSPIVHIPFDGPERLVAELSYGSGTLGPGAHAPSGPAILAPKGLDDIVMGPDGLLYTAAHLTGEIIRVDPADASACVLASGLFEPTSLRFAPPSWGDHAGDLYVTEMGGVGVTALFGPGFGTVWRLDIS